MDKSLILSRIKLAYSLKNDAELARFLEIQRNTLSNWYSRNTIDYDKVFLKCELLNFEWLLTGQGEMLKEPTPEEMNLKPMADALPLVMPTAIGGYGNSAFNFTDRDVKEYYVIPKFKHKQVDFMIEVEGSSMYPKYNSGDVVACRIIKDSKFIQWNKAHVVATREQGIIIKRIKPSDNKDTLLMVSDNQSYDPFEVPKEEIEGLAIVVGVVRLE